MVLKDWGTVRNILKAASIDLCSQETGEIWDEFEARHAASLWQCDFFSQKVLALTGIREVLVLVFLHVETRRVILSPATLHPNEAWVTTQAEAIVDEARSQGLRVRYVQRDRDGKYRGINAVLKRKRVKVLKGAVRAPNTRAFVERFIGTVRRECLKTWLAFYLQKRPHQGKENEPLTGKSRITNAESAAIAETISLRDVRYEQQLGGLLKSYSRKAA